MHVAIVNPLPTALRHYQAALVQTLEAAGHTSVDMKGNFSIEYPSAGRWRKAGIAVRLVWRLLRGSGEVADVVLVLWPAFGYLDAVVMSRLGRGRPVYVIMHDPVPLRRTFGYAGWALLIARWLSRRSGSKVAWLVHGETARRAIGDLGVTPYALCPHPILDRQPVVGHREGGLTVLGQFKPSRDLSMLETISDTVPFGTNLRIVGRGWPDVRGWSADSRFVSEDEFDEAVRRAECVVVPYSAFFQSGVAVRCLEGLTPVLAPDHEFIREVFGDDYPGMVTQPDGVVGALAGIQSITDADIEARRVRFVRWSQRSWGTLVQQMGGGEGGVVETGEALTS
jgi:hypothetical protein